DAAEEDRVGAAVIAGGEEREADEGPHAQRTNGRHRVAQRDVGAELPSVEPEEPRVRREPEVPAEAPALVGVAVVLLEEAHAAAHREGGEGDAVLGARRVFLGEATAA